MLVGAVITKEALMKTKGCYTNGQLQWQVLQKKNRKEFVLKDGMFLLMQNYIF